LASLRATACALACLCSHQLLAPGHAAAEEAQAPTVFARVVIDRASVRAGPSVSYRKIYEARRDEVFPVRARATVAYYFQVELPDGTTGFIQGDAVYNHELGDGESAATTPPLPALFSPPQLPTAHAEVALLGGVLGGGGFIALRPTWLLAPSFGVELTGGAAVARGGRLFLAMLGPVVNLFPSSPVVPFFNLAGGVIASSPNADTFLLSSGYLTGLSAGCGLRINFRYRLTLRLEARSYVFFETDRYVREEELSAGLTVFL
jgi:hypothetical protein